MSVLREDLAIEMKGVTEEKIPALDGNTAEYRKAYSWRNMLRTLLEIDSVVTKLDSLAEFKATLASQPPEVREQFRSLLKEFQTQHAFLKGLRNDVGGHVSYPKMEEALKSMRADHQGFLHVGETLGETHYGFAGELVLEMMQVGVPEEERPAAYERMLSEAVKLVPVFSMMDTVISMYAKARGLKIDPEPESRK